jgi:hypothetical protein
MVMLKRIGITIVLIILIMIIGACTPSATTVEIEAEEVITNPPVEEETEEEMPPTATMEPTDTPEPTATSRSILWEDDFSEVTSGWERYREIDGVLDYVQTEEIYQMQVNADNNLFWVMKDEDLVDVTMSVEAWQVDGPEGSLYGLMCRYDPSIMDGYFFLISSQGEAGIGTFNFGFEPIPGGELAVFDAIQTGLNAKNTITASCTGKALICKRGGSPRPACDRFNGWQYWDGCRHTLGSGCGCLFRQFDYL